MNSPDVLRIDEKIYSLPWPEAVKISEINIDENDTLIMCSGFEERSVWSLDLACSLGAHDFNVIHIAYDPYQEENKTDLVAGFVEQSGLKAKHIRYDRFHPAGIGESVTSLLAACNGRIYIDVSGMSRLLIVQVLVGLARGGYLWRCSVIYSEAVKYFPTETEFADDQVCALDGTPDSYISMGVYEVAATPELSAIAMQGEAIRLVLFPSFNRDQVGSLLMEILPTYLEVIYGEPSDDVNRWRLDAIKRCNHETLSNAVDISEYESDTIDYRDALMKLLDIYSRHSVFDRILISPTGSKMQSIAVAIIKIFLDDVQIVYPIPHEFADPNKYTEGVKCMYLLDMSSIGEWFDECK